MQKGNSSATAARQQHVENYLLGMGAGAAAYFLFAAMSAIAKLLTDHHHVFEIAFYRNLVAVLPFFFIIFVMGKRDILKLQSNGRAIVVRSVLGTFSLVVTFAAYAAMPMADTTAFLFTTSLIVPALGFFFLGEKVGYFRWSAIIIGFAGVLIMLQPTGEMNMRGVVLALVAAASHAVLQIILRGLGKIEKPQTVTFYFLLLGTVLTAIPLPFFARAPLWEHLPLLLGVGLCGGLAQFLHSVAHRNAPANIITVFNYSGIIWATLFGWLIWNDWPTATIWIGGAIVIASNVVIVLREARLKDRGKLPSI